MTTLLSYHSLLFIILMVSMSSCGNLKANGEIPGCISAEIERIKNEDLKEPPVKVFRWEVDNRVFFYFTSECCEQFNYLYDTSCHRVCAPDGGLNGMGDGSCPDFIGKIEKTLIWEDERTP